MNMMHNHTKKIPISFTVTSRALPAGPGNALLADADRHWTRGRPVDRHDRMLAAQRDLERCPWVPASTEGLRRLSFELQQDNPKLLGEPVVQRARGTPGARPGHLMVPWRVGDDAVDRTLSE